MSHNKFTSSIEACYKCATACDHCSTACLQEPDPAKMADCIRADLDCADICRLAAAAMARGSEHAKQICRLCADICEACGELCAKHEPDHCQECARACKSCADECRKMAA